MDKGLTRIITKR